MSIERTTYANVRLFEASKLVANLNLVGERKVADAKALAYKTALPMEEQERQLDMAVVWEQNFADFDEWARSISFDPNVVAERERPEMKRVNFDALGWLMNTENLLPIANLLEKFRRKK